MKLDTGKILTLVLTGLKNKLKCFIHLSLELDFVKCTWVGILTSTTIPGMGTLTRLPSWKVERIWEWVTSDVPSWKIPRIVLSESLVSKDGWTKVMKEYCVVFLNKNVVFMPIGALSLKLNNIRYFSFNFEKRHSYKSSIRSKFTSYLNASTRFRPAKVFDFAIFTDLLVYSKCQIKWNSGHALLDLSYEHQLNESGIIYYWN